MISIISNDRKDIKDTFWWVDNNYIYIIDKNLIKRDKKDNKTLAEEIDKRLHGESWNSQDMISYPLPKHLKDYQDLSSSGEDVEDCVLIDDLLHDKTLF